MKMKAAVFVEPNRLELQTRDVPDIGPQDALVRITTTTICGTDIHILKGEYPVAKGRIIGHEPVGIIEKLGSEVKGYKIGQRVIAGAISPSAYSNACLCGASAQDDPESEHGFKIAGGFKFGNTIDGCQAEFLRVPYAMANLSPIPDHLSDEEVLMCPDIMSTGFSGVERGNTKMGDTVAVFALGPIGLSSIAGAKLLGATTIIGVDAIAGRLNVAKELGADHVINFKECDPVAEIMRITNGRGVDVAIEALGIQQTFVSCLQVLRPGGVLSSLGVYSGDLTIPVNAFGAGLGDFSIVSTLCPGGKERMRRLMSAISSNRVNLKKLVTHRFKLSEINEAYDLFANQRDGVMKVAITP